LNIKPVSIVGWRALPPSFSYYLFNEKPTARNA